MATSGGNARNGSLSSSQNVNNGVCFTPMRVVSNGILQGDMPLNFALPLLIVQISLVILVTRTMGILIRPIKQPRVLAEIIGGVLLGPTALGRNKLYLKTIFPSQSMPLLETIANIGLMFYIFMVGLGLDLQALRKSGKHALLIALVGISVPLIASIGLAELVKARASPTRVNLAPLVVFMGAPISTSAFSVLVRILAELNMLNSDTAKLAVPSGALNDVVIWILLVVGVATSGSNKSPFTPLWVLLCGVAYSIIMLTLVRTIMRKVAREATKQGPSREIYVCVTLLGVLIAGFLSDAIGVHPLLGPFFLGLIIPKDNDFPSMMTQKIEDFVTGLLLPLFFALSGLKTNLGALHGTISIGFLMLLIATATVGKVVATFVTARLIGINNRSALILGFLMNAKGLSVLIVLNIGRDLKVLTDETFAILVLTCLSTSFITTPVVLALCKPAVESVSCGANSKRTVEGVEMAVGVGDRKKSNDGLRVVTCADGPRQHFGIANLLEGARGSAATTSPLKIYSTQFIEISDHPSTFLNITINHCHNLKNSPAHFAFPLSPLLHKPIIRTVPVLSHLDSMAEDICKLASKKHASLVVLPHHRSSHSLYDLRLHKINQRVLEHAPCSVALLVEKESTKVGPSFFAFNAYTVMMLFIGGPDDREALTIATRMIDHPGVALKLVRLMIHTTIHRINHTNNVHNEDARLSLDAYDNNILDDDAVANIKSKGLGSSFVYEEVTIKEEQTSLEIIIKNIAKDADNINLFIVGRSHVRQGITGESLDQQPRQYSVLGVVGEFLISTRNDAACILVVQQHMIKKY